MDLTPLKKTLHDSGIIDAIKSVCAGQVECYLVGGALRDCLLGRKLNDFDFCFPEHPDQYAEKIANILGATWFVLDAERGHSRFVIKKGDQKLTCDFAPFRAPSLERDLHKRDFTINALALDCLDDSAELFDPLNGMADISAKQLRFCGEYSFQEDPLRCLKGIRHAVCLDMEIEPLTLQSLIDSAPQIDQVASERIRTELARMIDSGNAENAFRLMLQVGLLKELFGHASDEAFTFALNLVAKIQSITHTLKGGVCGQVVSETLKEKCEENISINTALKLGAFFYGYRPVALKTVLQALKFSKRTINLIEKQQSFNKEFLSDLDNVANTKRGRARWLHQTGSEPIANAIFLTLITELPENKALLKSELLIDSFSSCTVGGKLPELVDGNWIEQELGFAEGPVVGRVFTLLHQAELDGEVNNPEDARSFLLAKKKEIDNNFKANL